MYVISRSKKVKKQVTNLPNCYGKASGELSLMTVESPLVVVSAPASVNNIYNTRFLSEADQPLLLNTTINNTGRFSLK